MLTPNVSTVHSGNYAQCLQFAIFHCGLVLDANKRQTHYAYYSLIARFVGPTWVPPGADRTQVGHMLAPWTLLSGLFYDQTWTLANDACLMKIIRYRASRLTITKSEMGMLKAQRTIYCMGDDCKNGLNLKTHSQQNITGHEIYRFYAFR